MLTRHTPQAFCFLGTRLRTLRTERCNLRLIQIRRRCRASSTQPCERRSHACLPRASAANISGVAPAGSQSSWSGCMDTFIGVFARPRTNHQCLWTPFALYRRSYSRVRASTGEAHCRLSDTIGFEWPAVEKGGRAKESSGMGPRGDLGQRCAMGTGGVETGVQRRHPARSSQPVLNRFFKTGTWRSCCKPPEKRQAAF